MTRQGKPELLCAALAFALFTLSATAHGQESLESVFNDPSPFQQQSKLISLVGNADLDALDGLVREALELEDEAQQASALEMIFTRYAELDPARSFHTGLQAGLPNEGRWMYGLAYWWAQKDLDAALAAAAKLEGETQGWVVRGIYDSQAEKDEEFLAALVERIKAILPPPEPPAEKPPEAEGPDFEAMWSEATAVSDAQPRRQALHRVVSLWSRIDPIAALANIDKLSNFSERRNLRSLLFSISGRLFPEEMIGLLPTLQDPQEQDSLIQGAFFVLAQNDGEHAWRVAHSLPTVELQEKAINSALSGWSSADPRAAAQAFAGLPNRAAYNTAGSVAIGAFARQAPEEALNWAESVDGEGGYLWNMTITSIAFNDAERAFTIISDISDPMDQRTALEAVLGTISTSRPELAIQYAELLPEGEMKSKVLKNAAQRWAYEDVLAVFDWVATQPESTQAEVMRGLAEPLARKDLGFAMSYPLDLVPTAIRRDWVATILSYAARENPAAAHAWIKEYQDFPEYSFWLMRMAGAWAQSDPYAALEAVSEIPDDEERRRAMSSLIGGWASVDGAAAAGWVENMASASDRAGLIHSVAYRWHRTHPSAARDWVLGLPSVDDRDRGLHALVNAVVPDIELSENYIRLIQGEERRAQAYLMLVDRLANTDITMAQRYLDQLDVPGAVRANMQEAIENARLMRQRMGR